MFAYSIDTLCIPYLKQKKKTAISGGSLVIFRSTSSLPRHGILPTSPPGFPGRRRRLPSLSRGKSPRRRRQGQTAYQTALFQVFVLFLFLFYSSVSSSASSKSDPLINSPSSSHSQNSKAYSVTSTPLLRSL